MWYIIYKIKQLHENNEINVKNIIIKPNEFKYLIRLCANTCNV